MEITPKVVLAGKFYFTVEPSREWCDLHGALPHYTYKITRSQDGKKWFAAFKTGVANNVSESYTYVGVVEPDTGALRLTRNSQIDEGEWSVLILRRVLAKVWSGQMADIERAGWNVHHEGFCCRCGRLLTVPASVETGIGPECESFVHLGIGGLDEVPNMAHRSVARLQYAYWMGGGKDTLMALKDQCLDEGMDDETSDHWINVTKSTMRKFKKGRALPQAFCDFVHS